MKFAINSKYSIGDVVYYAYGSTAKKGTIKFISIHISVMEIGPPITSTMYSLSTGGEPMYERDIFSTAKELTDYFFRETEPYQGED